MLEACLRHGCAADFSIITLEERGGDGAGGENRTRVVCLEDSGSATELRPHGGWCRSRTCPTRRSRRVSTALPCRSANHPFEEGSRQVGVGIRTCLEDCLLPLPDCRLPQLVSVGGFEPPISCFQGRQGRPGSPTRWCEQDRFGRSAAHVDAPASRSAFSARKNGAHGRTRTCTFLVRNQALFPVELRVRCWCRDGDLNSGCRLRTECPCQLDDRGELAPRPGLRTWISRVTTGAPAVG